MNTTDKFEMTLRGLVTDIAESINGERPIGAISLKRAQWLRDFYVAKPTFAGQFNHGNAGSAAVAALVQTIEDQES